MHKRKLMGDTRHENTNKFTRKQNKTYKVNGVLIDSEAVRPKRGKTPFIFFSIQERLKVK
jgi:hypothetical protein